MDRAQVCSIIASNQVCQLSPTGLAIVSRTAHYCRPFRHQLSDDINQPNSTDLRFVIDTLTFSCSLATIGRLEYSPPRQDKPMTGLTDKENKTPLKESCPLVNFVNKIFLAVLFFLFTFVVIKTIRIMKHTKEFEIYWLATLSTLPLPL